MNRWAAFRTSLALLLLLPGLACAATAAGIGTFSIEQNQGAEVGGFAIATLYVDNNWQPLADDLWLNVTWDDTILGYASTDFKVGNTKAATPIGTNGLSIRLADFSNKIENGKVAIAELYFRALATGTTPMNIEIKTVRSHGPSGEIAADLTMSAIAPPGSFTVGSGSPVPTVTAAPTVPVGTVTVVPTGTITVVPTVLPPVENATYGQAKTYYAAGGDAWSRAWGASDLVLIRQYLNEAKTAYTNCLNTANAVVDPANAANLALLRSISTAYIGLADAALAMYDGADTYAAGRDQMNTARYAEAATSFEGAAGQFNSSRTLFFQATSMLQSVTYAGTEFGDGTAYTAAIVPILNSKAAYMGEFASYAQGWQHTALAYQANAVGDQVAFVSEVAQAMGLFDGLRASAAFGPDASANYDVLAGLTG
ncbi:MAG: hypothetical protein GXY82_07010 [Methanospirillum sp.]|nr:hypothetical protein [Methanospirillum sp.]